MKHGVVAMFLKPANVHEVIVIAGQLDSKLTKLRTTAPRNSFPVKSQPLLHPPNAPTGSRAGSLPVKKLTPAEIQLKRDKGECWFCPDKWTKAHKCGLKQLLMLDVVDSDALCEFTDVDDATPELLAMSLSECAFYGTIAKQLVRTMKVDGVVLGQYVKILLDSGCTHNFINSKLLKKWSRQAQSTQAFEVMIADGGTIRSSDIFVLPSKLPPSQGHDHHIPLVAGAKPPNLRPYHYGPMQKSEIEQAMQELLDSGFIRSSHNPFSFHVLLFKKKKGIWHMCIDYKELNALTVKDKYPIPLINDLLDELFGAVYFSKLDLRSGQNCVEYLGYIVSRDGVQADPSKLEAIKDWHPPKTVKGLRGFLGFTGYYRKFIPGYGRILSPPGLLQPLLIPSKVWTAISMDFIVGLPLCKTKSVIMVVVDRLSKYSHFMALAHPYSAATVAQGSKLSMSSGYHLQSDGQSKMLNRCLETYLRCFVEGQPKKWVHWLSWAEWCFNTFYHTSSGLTLFEVVYGYPHPHIYLYEEGPTTVESMKQLLQQRDRILDVLKHNLDLVQNRMKVQADKRMSEREFAIGDLVYLRLVTDDGLFQAIPKTVLARKMYQKGNVVGVQSLIQWADRDENESTWEDYDTFTMKFPDFQV
ncbi:uncharacterized protein [Pyrus communis]|uniref:uncharacterized protein n=1 Tax=Pyrus communis TaxID=23211 RepID=UPI0035C25A3B